MSAPPAFRTFFPAVLFLATIGFIATDIYLPSFPSIAKEYSISKSSVQITLSLYMLSFSLSQLIYGPISDKLGRKKIALFGMLFSLLGTILCIFAPDISSLILGRFLQGLGLGAGAALMRAIFRDVYSGDDLSHYGSFIAVGTATFMAAAPVLGGYIQHYLGWRFNFVFIFLYTIAGLIIIFLWLPETHKELNPHAIKLSVFFKKYFFLIRSPIFVGYALCSSLAFAGLSAYLAASPFLFQNVIGLTPVEYGWLGLFIAVGLGAGGCLNTLLVKPFGRHRTLIFAVFLMLIASLLMLVPALFGIINTWIIMTPMVIYMLSAAIVFTNSFAGAFHPFPKMAGFVGALYGCTQVLGGTVATAVIALVHEKNQIPLALFLGILSICCIFLQWIGHHFTLKEESS